jgi:sugar lactone lactonase YvrE
MDANGDLFIADAFNNRVRKVDRNGTITTVAGTGAVGSSGDGAAAVAATLNSPSHIAVDLAGNLYISDFGNGRVRKVTADGVITTIAGNGGMGVGAENVSAKAEPLYYPGPLTLDWAGNLFVVDGANNRVRKVTPLGTVSTVVANSGTGGLAVDGSGNLYIADTANNRVRALIVSSNLLTLSGTGREGFGGDGGPANRASLTAPGGLALDGFGNLFIADSANARVRMILTAAGAF